MSRLKTVAMSEETFSRLEQLKEENDAKSFEELIKRLIEKSRKTPKSMFGVDKDLRPFTRKDEIEFEGSGRF